MEDSTNAERWDNFVRWAAKFYDWNEFDREEREYKLEIAARFRQVHRHLSETRETWLSLLKAAFGGQNNLVVHYTHIPFQEWCHEQPEQGARVLRVLWDPSRTALESTYAFLEILPKNLSRGQGTLLNLISCLHMEKRPESYPIYQVTPVTKAIKLVGYSPPGPESDPPHVYQHTLGLFARVLDEASRRGLKLRDPLDAQSLLWSVGTWPLEHPPVSDWTEQEQSELRRYRAGGE